MDSTASGSKPKVNSTNVFRGFQYYIIGSISPTASAILEQAPAKRHYYLSELVKVAISDFTDNVDEYAEAKDLYDIPVVSSAWVIMSKKCDKLLPYKAFQPSQLPGLFSGKCFSASHLTTHDLNAVWAMVTFSGGQVSRHLDSHVTHLITTSVLSKKYLSTLIMPTVKIVTPDWLVDCLKRKKIVDESDYHPCSIISSPALRKQLQATPKASFNNDPFSTPIRLNAMLRPAQQSSPRTAPRYAPPSGGPPYAVQQGQVISAHLGMYPSARYFGPPPSPTSRHMYQLPQSMGNSSPHPSGAMMNYGGSTIANAPYIQAQQSAHQVVTGEVPKPNASQQSAMGQQGYSAPSQSTPAAHQSAIGPHVGAANILPHHPSVGSSGGQLHPSQLHPSHQHPSQQITSQPHNSQPHHSQSHLAQAHPFQPHSAQPQTSQSHPSQPHVTQSHPSQPPPSQSLPFQPHPSQPQPSHPHPAHSRFQNQMHINQSPRQMHPPQAHPGHPVPASSHPNQMMNMMHQGLPHQMFASSLMSNSSVLPLIPQYSVQQGSSALTLTAGPGVSATPGLHLGHMTEVPFPSQATMPEETPIIKMTNMAAFPMGGVPATTRKSPAKSTLKNITNSASELAVKSKASKSPSPAATESIKEKSPNRANSAPPTQEKVTVTKSNQPVSANENVYYGYDVSETVPVDMCLIGCIFYMGDYLKILSAQHREEWTKSIEENGGTVDPSYSNRVTHVLVETQYSDVFRLALNDHKRVVTAHWLNDVIGHHRMDPPWQACHLPHPYSDENRVCADQVIGFTGFNREERLRARVMVKIIGASFTSYLARSNTVLVCKKLDGEKAKKAAEWSIPCVNMLWLSELVLGNTQALKLPLDEKYLAFGKEDDFSIDPSEVPNVMSGWRVPLKIPKDCWRKFKPCNKATDPTLEGKRKAEEDLAGSQAKRFRLQDIEKTGSNVPASQIVVLLTGFPEPEKTKYVEMVNRLGARICTKPDDCTHLIADKIVRTPNFLLAMNYCLFITSAEWIVESLRCGHFLDERAFTLHESETVSMWNLMEALDARRTQGKPFAGLTFHITPDVSASAGIPRSLITSLIQGAGGILQTEGKRWSAKRISEYTKVQGKPAYIVITCRDDIHLCTDLITADIDVYSMEFVLTGVMSQKAPYNQAICVKEM